MLKGKTILAVDDEPDVLETIVELLDMCRIETAGNFDKAQQLLRTRSYDMVILDIMGVKGLDLLDTAVEKAFPCVMLTAPALSPDYLLKAMQRGSDVLSSQRRPGQFRLIAQRIIWNSGKWRFALAPHNEATGATS